MDDVKAYFYEYGELDKIIVICSKWGKCIFVDKYLRYVVDKELLLPEVTIELHN